MKRTLTFLLALTVIFAVLITPSGALSIGKAAEVLASEATLIKAGLRGQRITFKDTDFKEALGISDFKSVTIESLPPSTAGTLLKDGKRVRAGQVIKRKYLPSLVFVPASVSVDECEFTFSVAGQMGGAAAVCKLYLLDKVNYAPKVDGATAETAYTQSGISLYGKMAAKDPEGDALTYFILSYPENGTLDGVDRATGAFRYTPNEGYIGKDGFVYVVRDCYGNYSTTVTVPLCTEERLSSVCYADMTESPAYNAAVALEALGVMEGTLIGDNRFFRPDETVTRAEFTAMALKTCGISADSTLTKTFFEDNAKIPAALVSYVATAQKIGVVNGTFADGGLFFRPNDAVTPAEAAVILSSLLELDGRKNEAEGYADAPAWAATDVAVMMETGIFDDATVASLDGGMTREAVAEMLYRLAGLK